MDPIFTIHCLAAYLEPNAEEKTAKRFWSKYKVAGKYNRGGDHYSSWTLVGTLDDLKRCIKKEWGMEFEEAIENEDELKLIKE